MSAIAHPLPFAPYSQRCIYRRLPAICLAIGLSGSNLSAATDTPLWFGNERPKAAAQQAVELLSKAAADGLEAGDYSVDRLRGALERSGNGQPLAAGSLTALDQALTVAVRRYLTDLHFGRVDPRRLGVNYSSAGVTDFTPDALLNSAIVNNRFTEAARGAAPTWPQYVAVREALARYRELTGNPAWLTALPPLPAGKLSPGQKYPGIPALTQRLILLADLPATATPPPRYEGQLVEGVKSFQERHGMTPDGIIGKETLEQLNVSPPTRARQLELALERLRWTPLQQARRGIVVNIPEFALRGYDVRDGRIETRVAMRVIVGAARKTRTPLFDSELRLIEFSPYWNVPPSIAKGETLPRLRRDPGYFNRQGFEFVGSDGRVIEGFSEADLDAVQRGQLRIRQRPGASNALGDIKFVFPNKENIYLHHTPTLPLFKRDRRDFSHGCIRVEAPAALAKFVLADEPEWTEERIAQAMRKGKSATIRLKEPVPVVLGYSTATVREGRVYFFPDIYGHDKILDNALRQRSTAVQASKESKIAAESIP